MTLSADEFMRRFLLHVLPSGFHRIRHFGLIANNGRKEKLALARELLNVASALPTAVKIAKTDDSTVEAARLNFTCVHCAAQMILLESFPRWLPIRGPPPSRGELC
jgi:hypothetical protein